MARGFPQWLIRVFCLLPFSSRSLAKILAKHIEEWLLALSLQPSKAMLESGLELPIGACGDCSEAVCPAQFIERSTNDITRLIEIENPMLVVDRQLFISFVALA